jgi:putative ABC transport system substrate-binding protein
MDRWGRRQFVESLGVAGLGLLAGCGRLPWQAAPPPKTYRLGWFVAPYLTESESFWQGLRELGYVEGQNLAVDRRWSTQPDLGDLDALAAEMAALQVDVIITASTLGALAAKRATGSIPIVFTSISDPVGSGLAASLGRPEGNATGLSDFGAALSGKRLELLRDAVPGTTRVGVVWPPRNPANMLQWRETDAAAPSLGVQAISLEVGDGDALEGTFETAVRERVEALIVLGNPEIGGRATAWAAELRLPTLLEQSIVARAGGLMAYGPNRSGMWRRAADYVDRILKGARPADLPVEQPREFEFVINLKTAQAIGLTIPEHVLLQATEVIQ